VLKYQPKTFCEVGIQEGWTADILLKNCPSIERYIGFDILQGTELSEEQRNEVPVIAGKFALWSPKLEIYLDGREVKADMFFIDGDHRHDGIKRDTEMAMKSARVIVWHDYGNKKTPDVTEYLDQMCIKKIEGTGLVYGEYDR